MPALIGTCLLFLLLLIPAITASPAFLIDRSQPAPPDVNVTTWVAISRGNPRGDGAGRGDRYDGKGGKGRKAGPPRGAHGPTGRKKHGLSGLTSVQAGQAWYTAIQVGGKTYQVTVDTGSSDTWLATPTFSCIADNKSSVSQSFCDFGPLYKPGPEFSPIEIVNLNLYYGKGYVKGSFGMTKVSVGGITVNQQLAIVKEAGWISDGISSGMMGLSYPSITLAFSGANYSAGEPDYSTQIPYSPLFTTMWKEHKIPPTFSIAIGRPTSNTAAGPRTNNNSPGGYLAFGGLPPVSTAGKWARADIEAAINGSWTVPSSLPWPQIQFYTITPDAFLYTTTPAHLAPVWKPLNTTFPTSPSTSSSSSSPQKFQVLIDSGYTNTWLPTSIASHVASLFDPPAVLNPSGSGLSNQYSVRCDAKVPQIAIKIGGVILPWDKKDLIFPDYFNETLDVEKGCISGVANGGDELIDAPYTFGDSWMRSNLVVHDVGRGEIRIKSRGNY
ncbi:hypothetical protein VTL71DRAFT_15789 [Oculimacula yallundae]|uniref:Peptidase A1 domain-containing protein n=1 Tax=Oculimacula yallundae TaxID=86028 RepID=A0ABR4CCL1_9HELO